MRLNKRIRFELKAFAKNLVLNEPQEKTRELEIQQKEELLSSMAKKIVDNAVSNEELRVLKKFNFVSKYNIPSQNDTQRYAQPILIHAQETWGAQINYSQKYELYNWKGSLPRRAIPLASGHPFWKDVEELKKIRIAREEHVFKRLQAYYSIINAATTMKKLLEIWPEAAEAKIIGVARSKMLPATVTPKHIKTIQADMKKRKAVADAS